MFQYFQQNFQICLIIFARIFGLLLLLPVLSSGVPITARAGLSLFTALLSAPMVIALKSIPTLFNITDLGIIILSSFLVGLSIGFVVQVTVSAFQLSSAVFSNTMGLTFSENLDPLSQIETPALGNFLSVIIMMLFIRTESHIIFIEMIVRSFQEIPIIQASTTQSLLLSMKTVASIILALALRISLPIIGVTLLLDIAMGIIGRVAPQFNVMIMGWNIKIIAGFMMLWLILPGLLDFGTILLKELHDSILRLIKIAKGN